MPGFMANVHTTRKQKREAGKDDLINQHVGTTQPVTKRDIRQLSEVTVRRRAHPEEVTGRKMLNTSN